MKKNLFILLFLFPLAQVQAQLKSPGMVSYTFRNSLQKNMAVTLDTIKALGVSDMEFSNLFGETAAEIRKLLD